LDINFILSSPKELAQYKLGGIAASDKYTAQEEKDFYRTQKMFDNANNPKITLGNIRDSCERGVTVWNAIVEKVQEFFEEGLTSKVRLFTAEKKERTLGLSLVPSRYSSSYLLRRHRLNSDSGRFVPESRLQRGVFMNSWLIDNFIYMIRSNTDRLSKDDAVNFAFGEGNTLLDAADKFKRIPGFEETNIEFIAGPLLVKKSKKDKEINEFISEMAKDRDETNFKLNANRLISESKMFAGFFHFYIVGDAIFAELPHGMGHIENDPRAWLMIFDKELAKELGDFYRKYKETFTESVTLGDLRSNHSLDDKGLVSLPHKKYKKAITDNRYFWRQFDTRKTTMEG